MANSSRCRLAWSLFALQRKRVASREKPRDNNKQKKIAAGCHMIDVGGRRISDSYESAGLNKCTIVTT